MSLIKTWQKRALKYGQTKLERRKDFPNTLRNPEYLNARLEDIYFLKNKALILHWKI